MSPCVYDYETHVRHPYWFHVSQAIRALTNLERNEITILQLFLLLNNNVTAIPLVNEK